MDHEGNFRDENGNDGSTEGGNNSNENNSNNNNNNNNGIMNHHQQQNDTEAPAMEYAVAPAQVEMSSTATTSAVNSMMVSPTINASRAPNNTTTNTTSTTTIMNNSIRPPPAAVASASSASAAPVAVVSASVPTSITLNPNHPPNNGLSTASHNHQSMLRQLAHLPPVMGRAGSSISNNNRDDTSNQHNQQQHHHQHQQHNNNSMEVPQQGAVMHAEVGQQQPQQALNINVAAPPNNNNNINNIFIQPEPPQNAPEHATESEDLYHPCSPSGDGTASSGWSVVETSQGGAGGAAPSARSLHAAALLNGIMYVFGGYDGTVRVNTFHAFSFAEKRWSPVLPSSNSAGPPSPRDRHVAVAFGNSFYIHGGFDGTARTADLWAFDFSSMTWREIVPLHGRPPSPRHSHAAVVYGGSMYVFGGYDGSYKSDLNEYDFAESRWTVVPAAGRRPRARYRATCVVFRNKMISYGGHDGTRHLSDAHIFDFDTKTWSNLVTEGTPPIPRDSHVSVVHGNSMYCFGGSSGSAMNDLHELQLSSNPSAPAKWRPVKISGPDQPRHRFCHVAVSYNDSMFIFGGYDGSERLNDFIRFDFAVYDLSFEVPESTIISDFRELINNETLSDVTFLVEEQPVHAHKLMLMRSAYFKALILGEMRESRLSTIRIEQVSHHIFLAILEYLYTDRVQIPFDCAMELFEAADLFCIPRLKTMCEKRMLQSISVENAAAIFHAADLHSALALRQKSKKYILSHFEEVSKTACFEDVGRSNIELVFELLQSR